MLRKLPYRRYEYKHCSKEPQRGCGVQITCMCHFICLLMLMTFADGSLLGLGHSDRKTTLGYTNSTNHTTPIPQNNTSQYIQENEKLCNELSNKDAPEMTDNPTHIYIVKGDHNVSNAQACGIESILRLFPDKTIYLIDFTKHEGKIFDRCGSPPNYIGLLQNLYKDRLVLAFANKTTFFKNTPLQEISKTEDDIEFFAMLLTAYKYGGFVTSPKAVMTSRELIECFPEETIVEPFVIITSKRCNDFLHYLMKSFKCCRHFLSVRTCLDEILTQTADLYSRGQTEKKYTARRLAPTEVCSSVNSPCVFLKIEEFKGGQTRWINDVSNFCKQVVQAYLGIAINHMEVEEETKKMKSRIRENAGKMSCDMSRKEDE